MTDRDTFIAGIVANPDDRVRQLAFADWLDEHGEQELAAKVRAGVLCDSCKGRGIDDSGAYLVACDQCVMVGWRPKCEHEGCESAGRLCVIEGMSGGERDDVEEWYCGDHAQEHGYCYGCGGFFSGIESFDFSRSGLCDNCASNLDFDDPDDELDDRWDDDFEP